eukprot:3123959-Rhodomonas_salina.1
MFKSGSNRNADITADRSLFQQPAAVSPPTALRPRYGLSGTDVARVWYQDYITKGIKYSMATGNWGVGKAAVAGQAYTHDTRRFFVAIGGTWCCCPMQPIGDARYQPMRNLSTSSSSSAIGLCARYAVPGTNISGLLLPGDQDRREP